MPGRRRVSVAECLLQAGALEALLVGGGLVAPPGGLTAYRPQQLYSLFNADVPVTDAQVRMTSVADEFRRFERQTDATRVIGGRDRALRVAFTSLADNMAAFSASCQLSADLITSVYSFTHIIIIIIISIIIVIITVARST